MVFPKMADIVLLMTVIIVVPEPTGTIFEDSAPMQTERINLTLLLREAWRTPEGITRVQTIGSGLGIEFTTSGRTSLAGKISYDTFVRLFEVTPIRTAPIRPGATRFGTPGGHLTETDLRVPDDLSEYVEHIAIAPPATRMHHKPER